MAGAADQSADSLRDIEFGFADARKDGAEAPELLLHGFFDDSRLTDEALSGSSFLFLGYKGSGKTALAERARLLGKRDPALFVNTRRSTSSPTAISRPSRKAREAHARYPTGGPPRCRLAHLQPFGCRKGRPPLDVKDAPLGACTSIRTWPDRPGSSLWPVAGIASPSRTKTLSRWRAARRLKVIMCSALGQESKVLESIKLGAKDFAVKPFQAERVLDAVGRALA